MLRTLFFFVLFLGAFLLTGAAEAAWGHTHVNKAWAGDLTYLEVEELTTAAGGVDPATQNGYWTLVLLAVHHDAAGDRERACELVARFEPIKKWRKDMRLDALRGACLLKDGSLEEAAKRAGSAARAAAGSEPVDYVGILFRAHQVRAEALLRLVATSPDDPANRKRARRALEAWERAARERNNPAALVLALAHKADLSAR